MLAYMNERTKNNSEIVRNSLNSASYMKHVLSNNSVPCSTKQDRFLQSYENYIKCKNFEEIIYCTGELND